MPRSDSSSEASASSPLGKTGQDKVTASMVENAKAAKRLVEVDEINASNRLKSVSKGNSHKVSKLIVEVVIHACDGDRVPVVKFGCRWWWWWWWWRLVACVVERSSKGCKSRTDGGHFFVAALQG